MLNLTRFNHASDFLDVAGEDLYREEALNCLMIGVVERLIENPHFYGEGDPYLSVVNQDEKIILAGTMTPPFGLLLSAMTDDVRIGMALLAQALTFDGITPPNVSGKNPFARQFSELWAERTGGSYELEMAQRIYELREVSPPSGVPGEFIQAESEHINLVSEWMQAFETEALRGEPTPIEKVLKSTSARISAGEWYLWQDEGEAVSMCVRTRPTKNGCSVGGVYTPPNKRNRGYASACVAALSQLLLDEGFLFTSLFTDLSNPTSNSIYMRMGYKPLADFDKYTLVG